MSDQPDPWEAQAEAAAQEYAKFQTGDVKRWEVMAFMAGAKWQSEQIGNLLLNAFKPIAPDDTSV